MLTPGFKLFFGFFVAGLVAAVVYGVSTADGGGVDYLGFVDEETWTGVISLGWKGVVGDQTGYVIFLLFAAVSLFLALMLVAFRDADADAVAQLNGGVLPPTERPVAGSWWPMIAAFGVGLVVIGLVVHAALFVCGLIVLAAVAFEWTMEAWAARATGDAAVNAAFRTRLMRPVEVPVIGALGIAVLVVAFSRVFLAVSKAAAVWVAVGISAVVFLVAVAFALAPNIGRRIITTVLVLGALGALAGGIAAAAVGEREFEHHEEEHEPGAEEGALARGVRW